MTLQKGIIRKSKKGVLSLMYVPHRGGIKVFKIPYYRNLVALLMCLAVVLGLSGFRYVDNLKTENAALVAKYAEDTAALKAQAESLGALVQEQQALLSADESTLNRYLSTTNGADNILDEFKTNYEDMIVAYIDKNMKDLKVSRGGESNKSFKEDVENLRSILEVAQNAKLQETSATASLNQKTSQLSSYLDALPTYWPVNASIGSDFGMRLHPVYHRWIQHTGVDMGASKGTSIYAAGDGEVTSAEYRSGYGKVVEITHSNGFSTLYAHCSEMLVSVGTKVVRGEKIAKVGQTGTATEPHLHFEVRINNTPVDPKRFISR